MTTELVDADTFRRALGTRTGRQPRGRAARPDIPAAGRSAPTGFTGLLARGWCVESPDAIRYRFYRDGQDTGLCADEAAACQAAKRLERP